MNLNLNLDEKKLFSVNEVASLLSISSQAVMKWIKEKKLDAFKIGRCYRITASSLQAYIESMNE